MNRIVGVVLVAATLAFAGLPAPASADTETTYYLSLGDSVAAGFQPVYRTSKFGYANQLYREVRGEIAGLQLQKLGCPGESTDTMIEGGVCPYREGSQLRQALAFLSSHEGHVSFVTINLGTNDIFGTDGVECLDFETGLIDLACVKGELPGIQSNLSFILEQLQASAPGVPIAGMTYYDPFLGYWVLPGFGEEVARADQEAMEALNVGLADTYVQEGAVLADVAGERFFDTANFTDLVRTEKWGVLPTNVANSCRGTWFCLPCPFCPDVHPTTNGYTVIARAFEEALGLD